MEVKSSESEFSKDSLVLATDKSSRKESVAILDRRFIDGMAPVKNPFEEEDMISNMEKALSRTVVERQMEYKKEKTELLIKQFMDREDELKHRKMLYRFRAVVRLMLMASSLKSIGRNYDYLDGQERKRKQASSLPDFNVSLYMRQSTVQIPAKVKQMLSKPRWLRSEDESELIYRHVSLLPFFNKYPRATLRKMAAVMRYSVVDKNRVVLRQGHMPMAFYFILSGVALVFVDSHDETGQLVTRQVAKLRAGASFGELALIHNTPRTATVTTKYTTELLSVDREDFDVLLKDSVVDVTAGHYQSICGLSAFDTWDKEHLLHLSRNCEIVRYEDKKVILGDVDGHPEATYFILDGRCRLVESLRVTAATRSQSTPFFLQPVPVRATTSDVEAHISRWASIVQRFLHIWTLERGQFFGVGEDLQRRYVISWGKVECLKISHVYLMRNGHRYWLELLQDQLQAKIPSHQKVFQEFVERATWRAYKKDMMNQLIQRRKKPAPTKLKDVPFSIRHHEAVENWNTAQIL